MPRRIKWNAQLVITSAKINDTSKPTSGVRAGSVHTRCAALHLQSHPYVYAIYTTWLMRPMKIIIMQQNTHSSFIPTSNSKNNK